LKEASLVKKEAKLKRIATSDRRIIFLNGGRTMKKNSHSKNKGKNRDKQSLKN